MTKVVVMWGSKKFDVIAHLDKSVGDFMLDLQKLTGVPVDRQKLMMRRKQFKPADSFGDGIKEGTKFMLVGTAELPPEPINQPSDDESDHLPNDDEVDEDGLTANQRKKIAQGLPNQANNCYLNATLQSFRALPLCEELIQNAVVPQGTPEAKVEQAVSNLFKNFPKGFHEAFQSLKAANPGLFAQIDEMGMPKQEDASESYFYLLNLFNNVLGAPFRRLFEIGIHMTRNCIETGEVEESDEATNVIPVYIDEETRQLEQGIKFDQEEESTNAKTGQPCLWQAHRKISSLPPYLNFHMQRFTYKKDENITAKLLRRVIHPFRIDMLQWLTPELRQQVAADREAGKSNSGFYRLKVVLTHKGRSANSGHYITHCKYGEHWFRFDDQKVTDIEDTDVEQLSGSGDWHCSLLLIYEQVPENEAE